MNKIPIKDRMSIKLMQSAEDLKSSNLSNLTCANLTQPIEIKDSQIQQLSQILNKTAV